MINQITQEDLAKHAAWLRGEPDGVRVVTVSRADLSGANLSHADLSGANLNHADLSHANLNHANLSRANLSYANLSGADLSRANLSGANLSGANLSHADLSRANLSHADLSYADLSHANLSRANLSGANLNRAKNIPDFVAAITSIVPEGELIVYKKLIGGAIATLRVLKEAKRSNATGRKCRAEYAEVLAVQDGYGNAIESGGSRFDHDFIYRVGETVRPHEWCEDRWQECAGGIHFYLTRYEAEND